MNNILKDITSRLPLKAVGGTMLLLLLIMACSRGELTGKSARKAAEKYYTMLQKGNYKGFVDGCAETAAMPEEERRQFVEVVEQFAYNSNMHTLQHVSAIADTLGEDSTAYVTLLLEFADNTSEQVGLPLVLRPDGWKME